MIHERHGRSHNRKEMYSTYTLELIIQFILSFDGRSPVAKTDVRIPALFGDEVPVTFFRSTEDFGEGVVVSSVYNCLFQDCSIVSNICLT